MNQYDLPLVQKARIWATEIHESKGQKYGGLPYWYHLRDTFKYAVKFSDLIFDKNYSESVLAACWTHDLIEDCDITFADVVKNVDLTAAIITLAVTNNGKRANESYYRQIAAEPDAIFVKLCDRLANVNASYFNRTKHLAVYKKEHEGFKKALYTERHEPMWLEINKLFEL